MSLDFDRLYLKYAPMIYRIGILYHKNNAAAEDLVQDVFVKLFSYKSGFDGDEHLKAWLITVARNLCRNAKKKAARLVPLPPDLPYCEKTESVLSQLYRLPKKDRLVVYLFYYEGYSGREIANMTSCTELAVRSRLKRAKRVLKALLEE